MSDATLPTLRSTSSEADLLSPHSSVPNSSEDDVYPLLVPSQYSSTSGEPPEVENGKVIRQKRKRTSPEDQATLEAEYKRNPKPDKAARVEILKRVSLGEKEVQIWFQNRRQNTRRKTRPLLPHEIVAFGLGGMTALSSAPVEIITIGSNGDSALPLSTGIFDIANPSQRHSQSSAGARELQRVSASPMLPGVQDQTNENQERNTSSSKLIQSRTDSQSGPYVQASISRNLSQSCPPSDNLPVNLGYLSNSTHARASSLSTPSSSAVPTFTASSVSARSPPSSCPERISAEKVLPPSSAQVRLSLSLDGKAELVSSQVSPLRLQHPQGLTSTYNFNRPSIQRSQNNIQSRQTPLKSFVQVPIIPRISSGRSRNTRTWEFCCDTEARDELTTQAENESSGSAVAAISLLRSTSTSNLKSNGSKRNAPAPKIGPVAHGKKLKLGRVSSSLARFQGSNKALLGSPSGDSDKENWLPQDASGNSQRRNLALPRPQKQKRRRVLEEPRTGSTHISGSGGYKMLHEKSASTETGIFEDPMGESKVDQDVDKFMRGEVSPSKKGDLDCIQGLLSLSQGTWR